MPANSSDAGGAAQAGGARIRAEPARGRPVTRPKSRTERPTRLRAAPTPPAASRVVPAPGPRVTDAPGSARSTLGTIAKRGCDTARVAVGECEGLPAAGAAETAPTPAT